MSLNYFEMICRQNSIHRLVILLLIFPISDCSSATKVVDFGPKLPEFVEQHPDKSWLIKFYTPWCYHCQQIETTYNNVAEKIYHKHNNLIVGQVDCSKHETICEKYGVHSYPTIIFISKNTLIKYKEGRNEAAIIDFAERLNGPDIRLIENCNHLKNVINQHGHIVLSTESNLTSPIYKEFKSLASTLKSNWWFYYFSKSCKNFIEKDGLYVVKKHLDRPIKFKLDKSTEQGDLMSNAIKNWLSKESFPVYGQFNWMNCERTLASGRILVIAIMDEYKAAKKFTQTSTDLYKIVGKLARKTAPIDENFMFVWTSDVELIQFITMKQISVPNIMILRSDYSWKLLIPTLNLSEPKVSLDRLQESSIKMLMAASKLDETQFNGGNTHLHALLRHLFRLYYKFMKLYLSDPLLAVIVIVFPTLIVIFVLYQTCFNNRDEEPGQEEAEEEMLLREEEEQQQLTNHVKQD